MLEPNAVSCRIDSEETANSSSFPLEVFERFSKQDLLVVLHLMHRILGADKKRDLERIVTELLPLITSGMAASPSLAIEGTEHGDFLGEPLQEEEMQAHIKVGAAQAIRLRQDKQSASLSPRELTVLLWMKEGKTNWEIARILGLSERTVRFHVGSIFEKLDVTSRTQAVAHALGTGLIAS